MGSVEAQVRSGDGGDVGGEVAQAAGGCVPVHPDAVDDAARFAAITRLPAGG